MMASILVQRRKLLGIMGSSCAMLNMPGTIRNPWGETIGGRVSSLFRRENHAFLVSPAYGQTVRRQGNASSAPLEYHFGWEAKSDQMIGWAKVDDALADHPQVAGV